MIIIINLKLLRANGDVKFKAYGTSIDEHFIGEYEDGDKFRIDLLDTEFVKIKLDPTLAESILYLPDGSFEFVIPRDYELDCCYHPEVPVHRSFPVPEHRTEETDDPDCMHQPQA